MLNLYIFSSPETSYSRSRNMLVTKHLGHEKSYKVSERPGHEPSWSRNV